jgi:ammonia channel protein AmtB
VIGVSAGADVYAPTLAYLVSILTAVLVVYAGSWIETRMRVDDAVGAVAVHGVAGFLGMLWVGVFAAGYPTGINNVESSIGGQLMGMMTFLPLGFLSGYIVSMILRRMNLLRVPPEVEVEGLDLVEYGTLVYPEMGVIKEQVVEPDGTLIETAMVTQAELTNGRGADFEAAKT